MLPSPCFQCIGSTAKRYLAILMTDAMRMLIEVLCHVYDVDLPA